MNPIRPLTFAFVLAAGLAQTQIAKAADVPSDFRVGTMTVRHYGDHGRPLILIPGLACGSWVWDETVARLKKDHVLYVVTLAGFEGVAPVQGRLLELAGDSLLQLIRTQHLDRPVLIGHSLGGTLSIQFAESHSDSISGVVAVDGLPIFPGTEGVPGWPRSAFPCLRSRPTMPPISPILHARFRNRKRPPITAHYCRARRNSRWSRLRRRGTS